MPGDIVKFVSEFPIGVFMHWTFGFEFEIIQWFGIFVYPIPYPYLEADTHYEKPMSTIYAINVSNYMIL
jgi:hypothetical protein